MNEPSMVSSRDMPAANRIGSVRIAHHGRFAAAAPPATTRSPTSVTVSKPRPKSRPTGYMCHGLVTELKLDRSFIFPMADDARAAALVASTIDLAHSLGLRMVAE